MRNKKAFSLLELTVVILIMTLIMGGGYAIFSSGQSAWFAADVRVQLQENLRRVIERVSTELRQSAPGQGQIFDGAGAFSTDVIRFSVPVVCETGGQLIDANGDVAYWGAPLIWGCTDPSCMDADDDCATVDYKSVEFRVNNDNQLVRRVLDGVNNLVREDVFAGNVTNFQTTITGSVVNISLELQAQTLRKGTLTAQTNVDVHLRN